MVCVVAISKNFELLRLILGDCFFAKRRVVQQLLHYAVSTRRWYLYKEDKETWVERYQDDQKSAGTGATISGPLHHKAATSTSIDHIFFFQAEDGIRDSSVTGVQTCALPIYEDQPREDP